MCLYIINNNIRIEFIELREDYIIVNNGQNKMNIEEYEFQFDYYYKV